MIQRIQTIWLLLCAACAGLAFKIPFGTSFVSEVGTDNVGGLEMTAANTMLVLPIVSLIIINALVAIILYKKRNIQILITSIVLISTLACLGIMIYMAGFQVEYRSIAYGIVAPFLAFIFSLLALKGIRKDNKLVKNLDRLR